MEIREIGRDNTPKSFSQDSFPPDAERAGNEKRGPLESARTSAYLILGAQNRAPIAGRVLRRSGAVVVFVPALIANQARYIVFSSGSYPLCAGKIKMAGH